MTRSASLVLLTALLAPAETEAGGFTITVMGGRRSSSLVNLARPDDPTAVFHNPAGLADLKGVQFHASNAFYFVNTDFRMRALDETRYPEVNPAGCGQGQNPPCPWPVDDEGFYDRTIEPESYFGAIPYLGVSTDLGFLGADSVGVGFSVYLPAFYGATMPADAPTRYHMLEGLFGVGSATFGAGWRVTPWLSVGANVSYNYMRIRLKRKLSVIAALTPPGEQPSGTAVLGQRGIGDITIDYTGVDHGAGWGVGVLLTPLPWLAIGLNYLGATDPRFDGPVSVTSRDTKTMEDVFKLLQYKIPKRLRVEMAYPQAVGAGISVAPTPRVEIGVDVRLWLYQLYDEQKITPVYDPDEPGQEPLTEENLSSEKRYHMSWEVAGGVLVRPFATLPGLELMAGLSYDQSPIPDETFSMDNPSLNSVNLAAGVRWAINARWRVCLSYMMFIYLERDIDNSETEPPSNGKGTGTAYLPAVEAQYRF
jgi:long-subunit fatty acid transport protein